MDTSKNMIEKNCNQNEGIPLLLNLNRNTAESFSSSGAKLALNDQITEKHRPETD